MALLIFGSGLTFAQSNSNESNYSNVAYPEKPSFSQQIKSGKIPAATLEAISKQNQILISQGRSLSTRSYARSSAICGGCRGMGAENGWNVWEGEAGENFDSLGLNLSVLPTVAPRFNITTGAGVDPFTPGVRAGDPPITLVAPPGFGRNSIQLGQPSTDGQGGGCSSPFNPFAAGCAERLTYCFTVGVNDTNFIYAYAFVMENPNDSSHSIETMPYVEFMILDAIGDTIPCAYQRYIASESFPGQYTCNAARGGGGGGGGRRDTAIYKPWTIAGVNLSSYIGQTLTVVITNADCRLGGHFAHSYWDFACGSTSAVVKPNCYTNAPDTLVAPFPPDSVNNYAYEWYLNNDTIPFDTTQIVTPYAQPGDTFIVKIILPSGCNYSARYVPEHFTIAANFTSSTNCGYVDFTAQSFSPSVDDPINYWSWNFAGGTPSVSNIENPTSVTFPPGNHTVTLVSGTYSPGCRDTIQYTVNVPQVPVAAFTASDICQGAQVPIANTSSILAGDTISSYSWYITGGNPRSSTAFNPVTSISNSGTSQITLIVNTTRGCKDTLQRTININEIPVASFGSVPVCFGQQLSVQNYSSLPASGGTLSYIWSFPGAVPSTSVATSPSVNYAIADTFPVTLIANSSRGCADTLQRNVIVHPVPQSNFSSPKVCAGVAIQLQNHSSFIVGDSIVSYSWSFPNGLPSNSNLFEPSVTYNQPDTVIATLIVTNRGGCKDTVQNQLIITPDPVAAFSANSICFGNTVQIQNTSSSIPAADSLTYQWSVTGGSPGSSTDPQPLLTYASPGTSTIQLIATATGGCKDTLEKVISIHPLPVADFSAPLSCFGSAIKITNLSSPFPGDTIASYAWTIANAVPTISSLTNPVVTLQTLDTSLVELITTTIHGCKDTAWKSLFVAADPNAEFVFPNVCVGTELSILNSTTIQPSGENINYSWSFPGASITSSSVVSPAISYSTEGTYTISLIARSDGGCADTAKQTITVYPLPQSAFTSSAICKNSSASLVNNSNVSAGSIQNYYWTLSHGQPAISQSINPSVRFDTAGTFPLTLIAETEHGCRDTSSETIRVYDLPQVIIVNPDSGCVPICHIFSDNSTSADGTIVQWFWSFIGGEPESSLLQNPGEVCYENSGSFGVGLSVLTDFGCSAQKRLNNFINLYSNPIADFSTSAEEVGYNSPVLTFTDNSSPNVVQWAWNFGDGSASFNGGPVETYSYSSFINNSYYNFNASLIVTTEHGCIDSITKPVEVTPEFTFFAPNAITPNGDGKNNSFYAKGMGIREYEMWIFDRWGLQIWSCHQEGSNVPWDFYGNEGMSSACQWDGTLKGEKVQQDVYVWRAKVSDVLGKQHVYIGTVTVHY